MNRNYELFRDAVLAQVDNKPFLNQTEVCELSKHCRDYVRVLMRYRKGRKIGRAYFYPIGEVIDALYEDMTGDAL